MKDPSSGTGWLEDVHIYPKNEQLSIQKTVGTDQLLHNTYNLLDSFPWTIDASVPSNIYIDYPDHATAEQQHEIDAANRNAIKYGIVDKLGTKFKYADTKEAGDLNTPLPLTVYQLDEDGQTEKGIIESNYYIFKVDKDNTISVYFNLEGRKYLKEQGIKNIRMVFYTRLTASREEMNKPIYNDAAEIDFTDEAYNNTRIGITNAPEVHTGKIKITKVDANNQDIKLQGAQFKIAASQKDAEQGVFLKRLSAGKLNAELEDILVTTDADGIAVIEGLAYGQQGDEYNKDRAVTKYYLVEVNAPAGYNQLGTVVEVAVAGGGAEYNAEVTVKNAKGILLQTSDTIDLWTTVLGVIISGVAIIYAVLTDKKNKL